MPFGVGCRGSEIPGSRACGHEARLRGLGIPAPTPVATMRARIGKVTEGGGAGEPIPRHRPDIVPTLPASGRVAAAAAGGGPAPTEKPGRTPSIAVSVPP